MRISRYKKAPLKMGAFTYQNNLFSYFDDAIKVLQYALLMGHNND